MTQLAKDVFIHDRARHNKVKYLKTTNFRSPVVQNVEGEKTTIDIPHVPGSYTYKNDR